MPRRKTQEKRKKFVMISVVAERFDIHPQTLRLYEREGLITPVRSAGNTRLYDERSLERLELILTLTRELGVNLAGVEVILNMRNQVEELQLEVDRLHAILRANHLDPRSTVDRRHALVKLEGGPLVKS